MQELLQHPCPLNRNVFSLTLILIDGNICKGMSILPYGFLNSNNAAPSKGAGIFTTNIAHQNLNVVRTYPEKVQSKLSADPIINLFAAENKVDWWAETPWFPNMSFTPTPQIAWVSVTMPLNGIICENHHIWSLAQPCLVHALSLVRQGVAIQNIRKDVYLFKKKINHHVKVIF